MFIVQNIFISSRVKTIVFFIKIVIIIFLFFLERTENKILKNKNHDQRMPKILLFVHLSKKVPKKMSHIAYERKVVFLAEITKHNEMMNRYMLELLPLERVIDQ